MRDHRRALRSDLNALMRKHLKEQELETLQLRFGLVDGQPRTLKQVGEAMGVPYATVKHLLFAALSKMRKPHVAHVLSDYMRDPGDL